MLDRGPAGLREHLADTRAEIPDDGANLLFAARLRAMAGDITLSKQLIARALAIVGPDDELLSGPGALRWGTGLNTLIAAVQQSTGDNAAALERLRTQSDAVALIEKNGQATFGPAVVRAELLALRGNGAEAVEALSSAVDRGWRAGVWARHEPQYASLQTRPDFQGLLARVDQLNEPMRRRVEQMPAVTRR